MLHIKAIAQQQKGLEQPRLLPLPVEPLLRGHFSVHAIKRGIDNTTAIVLLRTLVSSDTL